VQTQIIESVIEEINGRNELNDRIEQEKSNLSLEEFIVTMTI